MIQLRHQQPTVWESLFAEEVAELWEPWMREFEAQLFQVELETLILIPNVDLNSVHSEVWVTLGLVSSHLRKQMPSEPIV